MQISIHQLSLLDLGLLIESVDSLETNSNSACRQAIEIRKPSHRFAIAYVKPLLCEYDTYANVFQTGMARGLLFLVRCVNEWRMAKLLYLQAKRIHLNLKNILDKAYGTSVSWKVME